MIKARGIYWPPAAWHRYRKAKPGARRKDMGGSSPKISKATP